MLLLWLTGIPKMLGKALRWLTQNGRWKIAAVAITAILLAILIHQYRARGAKVDVLEEQLGVAQGEVVVLQQARVIDSVVLVDATEAKDAIAATEAIQHAETVEALKANPDWANEPIPADIIRSLRQ